MGKTWDKMAAKVASAMGKKRGWGLPDTDPNPPMIEGSASASSDPSTASAASPALSAADVEVGTVDVVSIASSSDLTSSPTETEESDGMDTTAASSAARSAPAVFDKTMRKKRKPTYYVRKDEMTRLKQEIEQLQDRLRGEEIKRLQADEALSKQLVMNAAIASDVKQNEMVVSGIRAMICARNAQRDRNPLETYIRLTASEDERRQTLLSLQEQKVFEGKEFIDEYCKRIVNPTRAMQDCQTYETQKGDYVLDQFDLTPFKNADSVRHAYDALLGFFSAQEVSITAMFGVLSVRETDDCGESTATQCRLLTTFQSGVQIETNAVMYLRYCDRDDDGVVLADPYGFVTIDYVNQDDLFPYQTSERVREDITMVGLIRAFPNPAFAAAETDAERVQIPETIVGMARWGFTRLVHPECPMPFGAVQELRDSIRSFSDVMPQVMAEIINTRRTSKFY